MRTILFVCSGNKFRSPMAEAFLNRLAEQRSLPARAISAGTDVSARRASEKAVIASRELGVDLSNHRPRQLDIASVLSANLILTMEKGQARIIKVQFSQFQEIVHPFREFIGEEGDFGDPTEGEMGSHAQYAQELWDAVETLAEKLQGDCRTA